MHPALHMVPALACACAAGYLGRLVFTDISHGAMRWASREAAEGLGYVAAFAAATAISAAPALTWAMEAAR